MGNDRPFVSVACLCDKVLVGEDKALTVVRIIDTITMEVDPATVPPDAPPDFALPLKVEALFCIRSGDVTGRHELQMVLRAPDGQQLAQKPWLADLRGGETGANLRIHLNIGVKLSGIYWLDLLWKDKNGKHEVLTSTPFRISINRSGMPGKNPESP